MSESADFVADERAGVVPAAAPLTAGTVGRPCPRCSAPLAPAHAAAARFCPRCGVSLTATVKEAAATPRSLPPPLPETSIPLAGAGRRDVTALAAAWQQLNGARVPLPHTPGSIADGRPDDSHSLMLLGYANAMYRLGWRYERGVGTGRNPEEAIRCYFKAAKLGNSAALARLTPQCMSADAPEPPAAPVAQDV